MPTMIIDKEDVEQARKDRRYMIQLADELQRRGFIFDKIEDFEFKKPFHRKLLADGSYLFEQSAIQ